MYAFIFCSNECCHLEIIFDGLNLKFILLNFISIDRNAHNMSSRDDAELPETRSQSQDTEDQIVSPNAYDGPDVWGQLKAKHKSFRNYGK